MEAELLAFITSHVLIYLKCTSSCFTGGDIKFDFAISHPLNFCGHSISIFNNSSVTIGRHFHLVAEARVSVLQMLPWLNKSFGITPWLVRLE